ncbi:zinc knuckle [Fusarium oxysporum f. sp. phaseoli]
MRPQHVLCQVGLPPGSPLSPLLFLFFNADLVQHKIALKSGSIVIIDDYSAWVTAPTAEANRAGIQAVIDRALEWERRSRATFEEDKKVIIHFTRRPERTDVSPYTTKGQTIIPKKSGKVQGLVMDSELHPTDAGGWRTGDGTKHRRQERKPSQEPSRQCRGLWQKLKLTSYPSTHPLATLRVRETRRYLSLLTKLALAYVGAIERMETIEPYALPPWHRHMVVEYDSDKEAAADADADDVTETSSMRQVLIATNASARNGLAGMGGVVRNTAGGGVNDNVRVKYFVTLSPKDEQNAYMAELEPIAMVLRCMPDGLQHRDIIVATQNRSALQSIAKPRQQSG